MRFLGYGVVHKETGQSKGLWPMTIEAAAELARVSGTGQWLLQPLHGGDPFVPETGAVPGRARPAPIEPDVEDLV